MERLWRLKKPIRTAHAKDKSSERVRVQCLDLHMAVRVRDTEKLFRDDFKHCNKMRLFNALGDD